MVNQTSPVAMYYQLKEIILAKINSGEYPPQSKMMSENELCAAYNVSRVTVRKALDLLRAEGYLYTVKGKGAFVNGMTIEQPLTHFYSFREELREKNISSVSTMIDFRALVPEREINEALAIDEDSCVFRVERVFSAEELPYAREVSYIPCRLCPELSREQIENNGLYNSLSSYNIIPTRASEKLKALILDEQNAEILQAPEGSAAIYITRTTYCNDTIVELNTSIVRGDMFVYSVELQKR